MRKISKFIEFTPEQKERAATVDLEEFLLRQGEKLIKAGREKRLASDHSVTVRGCEWFDHASNEGGRAVSFVQKYYGKSYVEAMSMLLGESMEPVYPQAKKQEPVDQKPFAPPVPNANMHRVFAYLLKTRGLDADVVSYGTARWATDQEIRKAYVTVPFDVTSWRAGKKLPTVQGLVLGSVQHGKRLEALVDCDDVHCLMIGASGVGKTAFFLYPNIEFACACGMSFLILDTKGDLARNCGRIAQKYYGYRVSVVDLRNPIHSDGNNLMTLVNRYMDVAREHPDNLKARANAEKYAKVLAKTSINPSGDEQDRGQNSYFYDAAEGVLATVIMTLSEFIPPDSAGHDKRHIMSVFKLMKELMAPMGKKNGFQVLVDSLPDTHKAGWMASAATSSSDQGMASVMSTALSRLNSFIDSEQEQVLCYDSPIDAEHFASEKCAIFLIIPEEDPTKHFMAGLMIQNLSRELFSIANANEGKLKKRVVFYCDEFGTMPPFDVLPLFSAGRSRKLTLVPIIQSLAQLEKNYGKEGAEIIADNCQDTIFGGFAPNSQTAETLSKALGSRTVLTGSISKGKDSNSQSLQMAERALLSPDELKSLPKGEFVVMKTGTHPMRTKLQLYFKWGIKFEEP